MTTRSHGDAPDSHGDARGSHDDSGSADAVAGRRIVSMGFVEGHGGDALQMLTLAHGMQHLGAAVELLVPEGGENDSFVQRAEALGVTAIQTPLLGLTGPGRRQRLRDLRRALREVDADILHVHTGDSCPPRRMLVAILLTRRPPVVVTIHSPYPFFEPTSMRARFWRFTAHRRVSAVVAPSQQGLDFQNACGIGSPLALHIPNAIDIDAFSSGDAAVALAALGVGDDVPIVLFSSRLDPQKRPTDAVRAFARVAYDRPDAILVMVGSGSEEESVAACARELGLSDRVKMVGYQFNIADWLAASTVWLFPTEREHISLALLEAMAAGCAIVATNCPGNDEILVDGQNSRVFAVGDTEAAGRALDQLLSDGRRRQELADGARTAASSYSEAMLAARYSKIYAR